MNSEVDTVKGFQDYLPEEALKRKALIEIIEKYYKLYGFLPLETPIIEFESLMKLPGDEEQDEAISDRYRFQDKGGRNLGLRYEFTFQLARTLKQNPNIKLPFRRYQIGPVFRDEPTKTGRTRQFIQCDVDIIGDSSSNADAECIALAYDILKELKIKNFEIQINNRKLLDSIIESVRIKRKKEVLRELDKIEKIGVDMVKANLRECAEASQIITLFKLLEKDISFFKANAFSGTDEIEDLLETLSQYKIKASFNPFLARGLSYYTGNIVEFKTQNKTTVIAGGRYDKTVGKFLARDIPATGISFSLEALSGFFPQETSQLSSETYPRAIVISISKDLETIELTKKLRKEKISCVPFFDKISKSLEYANSQKIPFAIFVGEEEMGKKKYKLRNLNSGKESLLAEKQLLKKLSS